MKKIIYLMMGVALISVTSCMETDNWDAPDARIYGTVIDEYTNAPLLTDQNDWQIRIWERSWKASAPQDQNLPVKADGTYNNSKLFAGTYDMLPYDGPFWQTTDTVKGIVFKKGGTKQDFTVKPYLQILDFAYDLGTVTDGRADLYLSCRLKAPITEGFDVVEIKPFLSLNAFCGSSNYINIGEYNDRRKTLNKNWGDVLTELGDNGDGTTNTVTIGPLPVKSGYTYRVRIGANVNKLNRKYNYSEIKEFKVP
ncbi:hypothetical protein AGMMS4957_00490 [Bacteroidia bacterium]|nr:hypothetical protein AGMMS4957_00490 [Bacteroidia bacterium]